MKRTNPIKLRLDVRLPSNEIVIHPNEGFDLGLMKDSYPVHIFTNMKLPDFMAAEGSSNPGTINLLNECPHETMWVGKKLYEEMKRPDKALLVLVDQKLLIATV